jgi:hypothetical protein
MKRLPPPPPAPEENMTTNNPKQANVPEADGDLLRSAAKAIGTTLGKIAVKTGIATAPAPAANVGKKAVSKKKPRRPRRPSPPN